MQEVAWLVVLGLFICLAILYLFQSKCPHELCDWTPLGAGGKTK